MSVYDLPTSLLIDEIECPIRSDFRAVLDCNIALQDNGLTDQEKIWVLLNIIFLDITMLPDNEEVIYKTMWFINGGGNESASNKGDNRKVFDWEQDFPLIISAVNRVAGCEVRSLPYLHWWTFLSYWQEIGECLFTRVLGIRQKLSGRKKLEPYEKEFYKANRELIDLRSKEELDTSDVIEEFWASATGGE